MIKAYTEPAELITIFFHVVHAPDEDVIIIMYVKFSVSYTLPPTMQF